MRRGAPSRGEWKDWLAELLDYRRWFGVQTEFRVPEVGGPSPQTWRPLTKEVHGQDSGGAKAVTMWQPLLATLVSLYSEAPDGPRPLGLDEAFTGSPASWPSNPPLIAVPRTSPGGG